MRTLEAYVSVLRTRLSPFAADTHRLLRSEPGAYRLNLTTSTSTCGSSTYAEPGTMPTGRSAGGSAALRWWAPRAGDLLRARHGYTTGGRTS
jgi:hypothetical protein